MADTKISALTAATTPLAGTEVLPIVQSGVTKQVSVANLTAGQAVSAASLTLTTTPLAATSGGTGQSSYAVGDLLYASTTTALSKLADVATGNALISGGVGVVPSWGKVGLTTHVSGVLPTANGGTNLSSFTSQGVMYASSTSALTTGTGLTYDGSLGIGYGINPSVIGSALVIGNYSATSATAQSIYIATNKAILTMTADGATNANGATISVGWANGGQGPLNLAIGATTTLQLASSGDVGFKTGNLVQGTAAKGINFTANTPASGMTSQLLNWYEEGTWTPTQGAGLTVVGTFSSSGRYTRVGRLVTIHGSLNGSTSIAAANGAVITSGYPFTLGAAAAGSASTSNLAGCATYLGSGASSSMYSTAALAAAGAIVVTATYYV
jgi:hypothetical protein